MKRSSYRQIKDGDSYTIQSGQVVRCACCDCGLVHDIVHIIKKKKGIAVTVRRNIRATILRRKRMNPPNDQSTGPGEPAPGEQK
jgi:nitrate/TMAO reductase-like tetraheme cytochrome c subunit